MVIINDLEVRSGLAQGERGSGGVEPLTINGGFGLEWRLGLWSRSRSVDDLQLKVAESGAWFTQWMSLCASH